MTNRQILQTPREVLGSLGKQRQLVLQLALIESPCPSCQRVLNLFQASGLDIDQYDCDGLDPPYRCPDCRAVLEQVVPFPASGPPWFWQLKPAEPRSLRADSHPEPRSLRADSHPLCDNEPNSERTTADGS